MRGARAALAVGVAILVAGAAAAAWVLTAPRPIDEATARAVSEPGDPGAGRIVFFLAGCDSCHMSPGQTDPLRLGGGQELKTPFGSFFPPNISPDRADGIGAWSAADFANALMAGVSRDGRHLYPALPYASYTRMSVKDVRDLFAFLKTTPPVPGRAPPDRLGFPFSIRRAVGFWKLLYMPAIRPILAAPTDLEGRGRYLVEGPGHCGECHTPRTFLGGPIESRRLTGAPLPAGKGKSANITAAGLSDWSESDIAYALSTGLTPSGDSLGGPMAAVVRNLSQVPQDDLNAIAHYIKTFRPGGGS
jgi:mono/diheme cytochrome c family protein